MVPRVKRFRNHLIWFLALLAFLCLPLNDNTWQTTTHKHRLNANMVPTKLSEASFLVTGLLDHALEAALGAEISRHVWLYFLYSINSYRGEPNYKHNPSIKLAYSFVKRTGSDQISSAHLLSTSSFDQQNYCIYLELTRAVSSESEILTCSSL